MFTVITCNKFARKGLVVVDVDDRDPQDIIDAMGPRECPVCGPCSHVELSWRGRYEAHGLFETDEEALDHARKMIADAEPYSYDDSRIPKQPKVEEAVAA